MSNVITGSTVDFGDNEVYWLENKVNDDDTLSVADLPERVVAEYANEIDKQFKLINSASNGELNWNAIGVSGAAYFGNNLILSASGAHITSSYGNFLNDVFITGSAYIQSNVAITGALNVEGAVTFGVASFDNLTINNDLDVKGNEFVTGSSYVENNVAITGTLNVEGAVDFDSTLDVGGIVSMSSDVTLSALSPLLTVGSQATNGTGSILVGEVTGTVGITGKMFRTHMHSFWMASTTLVYAPWKISGTTSTSIGDMDVIGMAPADGSLKELVLRSNTSAGGITASFYVNEGGSSEEDIIVNVASADTAYTFAFSASHYSKGDKLHISIEGNTVVPDEILFTSRWLDDYET